MTMNKKRYQKPIMSDLQFYFQCSILSGSVVDNLQELQTEGQESLELDFTSDGFNDSWDE